uniref:Uncharacterized protein n=1 Tax=Ixodes ricinus TaxID=34613 RepID=A0A6B0U6W6_IXORI
MHTLALNAGVVLVPTCTMTTSKPACLSDRENKFSILIPLNAATSTALRSIDGKYRLPKHEARWECDHARLQPDTKSKLTHSKHKIQKMAVNTTEYG